jgi:threonine dehydratase
VVQLAGRPGLDLPALAGEAYAFHQSLPGYWPTPLIPVPELAVELRVGRVLVKDESSRLGLPAFKVLGASWACRQVLQRCLTAARPTTVPTAATVMAGLNCGTVSRSAWPVLRAGCDAAVAVSDQDALRAVADLSRLGVSSGPSGAATLAGTRAALTEPARRAALGLDDDAVVVLLSTEGPTR